MMPVCLVEKSYVFEPPAPHCFLALMTGYVPGEFIP